MASLRQHVAARTAGSTLSRVDETTFIEALKRTRSVVERSLWSDRAPCEDELVAVVVDQLREHGRLTEDEYQRFRLLRSDVKRRLVLSISDENVLTDIH